MLGADMDGWKKVGAHIGMLIAGALPVIVPAYLDLKSRIDAGKDEQRAHWVVERHHKDSVDMKFQDTVLKLLTKHVH